MFRVTIVGRPNVGKSTLFNRICGARKSIVGDEPGITRDRIYGFTRWGGKEIEIIDTGGILVGVHETIPRQILRQVEAAIQESKILLLVVDGRAGITSLDEQLLPLLRRGGKPVWVIVNKIDTVALESETAIFHKFGFEALFPVSAEHGLGVADLLDAIATRATEPTPKEPISAAEEIAVAVVGRPNVGKSSLVNRLLGTERSIVSEIPGTTRDAIDTLLVREGVRYRLIDTAGIRRKGKTDAHAEKISVVIARKNLAVADVALLVLDAEEGVTKLDAAIGGYAEESGCSVILVLNKWDKVEKTEHTIEKFEDSIRRRMKYLSYAPVITVSATTGQRVSNLFTVIRKANGGRRIRIGTGALNNLFVPDAAEQFSRRRPVHGLNIRYITQASVAPPTFVIFTSHSKPLHFSTERFLVNRLREAFGFFATPIRIHQRIKSPKRAFASPKD